MNKFQLKSLVLVLPCRVGYTSNKAICSSPDLPQTSNLLIQSSLIQQIRAFPSSLMFIGGSFGSFIFLKNKTNTIFPCSYQFTGPSSWHWYQTYALLRFQGHLPHLCHWWRSCERQKTEETIVPEWFFSSFWRMKSLCSATLQYHASRNMTAWQFTLLQLWEFIFPLRLFYACVPHAFSGFSVVSSCVCFCFFLFPLDWLSLFLNAFRLSLLFLCYTLWQSDIKITIIIIIS